MSSPSPWIKEPETGRWYMHVRDKSGETVRRYSAYLDEVPVAASASSHSAIRHSTPRYTADAGTTTDSSKRRDSQSSEPRHQRPTQQYPDPDQQQPVSTYSRSGKKYHDPGGFGPPREGGSSRLFGYHSQNTASPQTSGTYLGASEYGASSTSPRPLPADPLATNMESLRINEVMDNTQYTATPLSEPVAQGSSNRSLSTPLETSSAISEEQTARTQWPPVPNNSLEFEVTYQPVAFTDAAYVPVSQQSAPVNPRHIVGTPGAVEPLDPRYSVRNHDYRSFFREGRVFSTLWTEVSSKTNRNQTFISSVVYGEQVSTKIRRFVVVRQRETCCNCLPVTSYEGRGAKKFGISLNDHAQIYSDKYPKKVNGISKKALKVIISAGAPKIKESSLVNCGRIYTVECNVKVMDIGTLDKHSRRLLLAYYHDDNFRADNYPRGIPLDQNSQGDSGDLAGVGTSFEPNPQNSAPIDNRGFALSAPNTTYPTQYNSSGISTYGPHSPESNSTEPGTFSGEGCRAQAGYGSQPGVTQPTTTSGAPLYGMNRTSTTVSSPIDPRYVSSSDPAEGNETPATQYYSSRISETEIVLPSREEIEASPVARTRQDRFRYSGRPRERDDRYRDKKEHRERGRERERERHREMKISRERDKDEDGVKARDHSYDRSQRYGITQPTIASNSDSFGAPIYDAPRYDMNDKSASTISAIDPRNNSSSAPTRSGEPPATPIWDTILDGSLMPSSTSDVSDIYSIWSSAESGTTFTSISQLLGNPQERLVALLKKDSELQLLFKDALQQTSFGDFEEQFRICLLQLSKNLRSEAMLPEQIQTSKILRNLSRNVSHAVRSQLERDSQLTCLTRNSTEFSLPHLKDSGDQDEGDAQDEQEISEEEDLDPIDDLQPAGEPLKHIEKFVLESISFNLLKEDLHLIAHPDQVKLALARIWPVTLSRDERHAIPYEIEWEVQRFLRAYFGDGQQLGNVLTLTENGRETQALSCRDYLSATWADTGVLLLEGLQELLAKTASTIWLDAEGFKSAENSPQTNSLFDNPVIVQSEIATLTFRPQERKRHGPYELKKPFTSEGQNFRSVVNIMVDARYEVHVKLMSALSWVCAAIRYSPRKEVMLGSTSIKAIKTVNQTRTASFRVNRLESLQSQHACWHSLFPRSVIAKGFSISSRKKGKGLEMSFADMALMSRSLTFVEYDGGLVVEGLSSLLIPIKILQDDDALQWHYESKVLAGSGQKRSVSDIFSSMPDMQWYKELQEDQLTSKRCFLGWVDKASIVLGTEDHVNFDIVRSGAAFIPKSRIVGSNSITLGTSGTGFVTFTGTRSWGKESTPSNLTLPIDRDRAIEEALADESKVPITVYDDSTKIAWCLPQASVCLQIVHSLLEQRDCQVSDQGRAVTLASEATGSTNASGAMKTLMRCLNFEVRIRSLGEGSQSTPLSRTIAQVWLRLNNFRDGLKKLIAQLQDAGFHPPENLIGVEFADVSEMSCSEVNIKKFKLNQPWVHFVHQSAVLFCSGLGQPIIPIPPAPPKYICSAWKTVPVGKYHLVLTADGILFFLNQQEKRSRLQTRVIWIQTRMLVLTHCRGESMSVCHTQELKCVKSSPLDLEIWGKIQACRDACFVFSDRGAKQCFSEGRCLESDGSSTSYESTSGSTGRSSVSNQDKEDFDDPPQLVATGKDEEEEYHDGSREYTLTDQKQLNKIKCILDHGLEQPRILRRRKSFNWGENLNCASAAQEISRYDDNDATHKSGTRHLPISLSYKENSRNPQDDASRIK